MTVVRSWQIQIHDGQYHREHLFEAARRSRACAYLADDDHWPLALQKIPLAGCSTVGARTGASFVKTAETGLFVERLPQRPPAELSAQWGDVAPRPLYYPTDIQPMLDRHCVRCHAGSPAAAPDLRGELTELFSRSYESLLQGKWVNTIQEWNGLDYSMMHAEAVPPYTYGSSVIHVVADGRLFTSLDEGRTWQARPTGGSLRDVVMARNQLTTAYACDRQNVYVTKDKGVTWKSTFHYGKNAPHTWIQKDIAWGYFITKTGLGCGQGSADVVTVATQAELYISNKELGAMSEGPGTRNESVGLEVSSCWNYYVDPHDSQRHYRCFSNFGLIRSLVGGKTWGWSAKGCPWSNTFYALAFDPNVQGRIYAATSGVHEIIQWIGCTPPKRPGGVCVSDDSGATWKPLAGLPAVPCTSIVIDEKQSRPNASVIYASLWSKGVYRSVDSGKTWVLKSGVGRSGNLHTFKITIHPKTNDLYVNVAACRHNPNSFPVAGGLWKSSDGGETWQELTEGHHLKWLNGYCVHPENPDIVFITGGATPSDKQGGVYRTTDGGRHWRRVLDDSAFKEGYTQGLCVEMNPGNPDVVFFGSVFGSFISTDGGDSSKLAEDIPFRACNNINFDPQDHKRAYIMSGGAGILKGPAPGIGAETNP